MTVLDAYTGKKFMKLLARNDDLDHDWSLHAFHGWYDLTVRVEGDAAFEYRLAGHVETGEDSTTDPVPGDINCTSEVDSVTGSARAAVACLRGPADRLTDSPASAGFSFCADGCTSTSS